MGRGKSLGKWRKDTMHMHIVTVDDGLLRGMKSLGPREAALLRCVFCSKEYNVGDRVIMFEGPDRSTERSMHVKCLKTSILMGLSPF